MKKYDFDTYIDRKSHHSDKWDRYKAKDIIPMWVADMDFTSPPEIVSALHNKVDQGVFGYPCLYPEVIEALSQYLDKQHNWQINPEWLVWLPGLVSGIHLSVHTAVPKGKQYLTCLPVYPPFISTAKLSERKLLTSDFKFNGKAWELDFEQMQAKVSDDTYLFLLCNPHNPLGKVWTKEELLNLANFCQRNNLICCSDEIHCDLILNPETKHQVYANLNGYTRTNSITLMAPSKTWNIAGIGCSLAIIPNPELRKKFNLKRAGIVPSMNLFSACAAQAAYQYGEPWRLQLIDYLRDNRDYLFSRLKSIPSIKHYPLDATYLAWLNIESLKLNDPAVFFEKAGVGLSAGIDFGDSKHLRLNFGCSRATLKIGLDRIEKALTQ